MYGSLCNATLQRNVYTVKHYGTVLLIAAAAFVAGLAIGKAK
jgi:hypothetical protein